MENDYVAAITAQAAVRHVERGELGEATMALADACIWFGQWVAENTKKRRPVDSRYNPEREIVLARVALLKALGAPEDRGSLKTYSEILVSR